MPMLLSVIVPVYNGEKTLPSLIEPILSIKRNDIEIILVDDGSKDNSYSICKNYSKIDNRITPIHIKNSGVSSARNAGLQKATGKYIYFCDCDDFVFTDTLEKIIPILKENKYDLITADYIYKYYDTGTTSKNNINLPPLHQLNKSEIVEYFITPLVLRSGTGLASLWNKLFRLSLINEHSLRFNYKIHKGEDWQFILKYLSFANSAYYIPETLYEYRLDGSQTENKYRREPGIHLLYSTKLKIELAKEFNIEVSKDQTTLWCANIMGVLIFTALSDIPKHEWIKMVSDDTVHFAAKTLLHIKSREYLRLAISRKYKLYAFFVFLRTKRFLRFLINKIIEI